MALDGVLMSRARGRLSEIKEKNEAEQERRREEVYARLPGVRRLDGELRSAFAGVVSASLRHDPGAGETLKGLEDEGARLLDEKTRLLLSAGYPADYLEDIYSCKNCRDTGVLPSGRLCGCLLRLYDEEQTAELSSLLKLGQGDFADFDLSYYSDETDPERGVSPREHMELVFKICREYALRFGEGPKNLLLHGGTGLGKTFLSACIAKTVAGRGFSVVYETASAAFEAFEAQKFSRSAGEGAEAADRIRRMLGCDLFILDDLGTELTTSLTQSALYTIVNSRHTEDRQTVISTNLTPEELAARYSGQTVSRIEGEYDPLLFLGRDIRAIKRERRYGS